MLRAVIFDLGGTLMSFGDPALTFRELTWIGLRGLYDYLQERTDSSLPNWQECLIHLDAELERAWQRSLATLQSARIEDILQAAFSRWQFDLLRLGMEGALDRFHAAMQPYISLYDDTLVTLEEFTRRKLKIGLISNTIWPPQMHDLDLQRLGIIGFFAHRLYSSASAYVKPHPAIFKQSLAALQVAPEEAIYVGDRLWDDVGGAQAAGLKGILKEVPQRAENNETIVPDARVRSLRELWDVIDSP